ncbi:MAG: lysophospholipid acyltransferase family protein [Bacilli bacterium]|jgi:1-acyl-sn-glycerol-3-phosphate acyltransferase
MIIIFLTFFIPICACFFTIYYQFVNYNNVIWWTIPLSMLAGVVACAIILFLFIILSLLLVNEKHKKFYYGCIHQACSFVVFLLRIKVISKNLDKLSKAGNFFLVSNHLSNLDPIIHIYALKNHDIAYIMKKEIMSVPIVGVWLKRTGFLVLDRKDNRQATQIMLEAIKRCKNKENIGVFPEGTRSRSGELLPLKSGVFKIPQKAEVPILVTHLFGTNLVKKKYPFKRTTVNFEIIDLISNEELKEKTTNEISDKITDMLLEKNEYLKKQTSNN